MKEGEFPKTFTTEQIRAYQKEMLPLRLRKGRSSGSAEGGLSHQQGNDHEEDETATAAEDSDTKKKKKEISCEALQTALGPGSYDVDKDVS